MAKEISIMYSINVFFEKKFQVDDDFVLNNRCGLKEAFEEIAERFPEKDDAPLIHIDQEVPVECCAQE